MKLRSRKCRDVQPVRGVRGLLAGLVVARGEVAISFDNLHAIPLYS